MSEQIPCQSKLRVEKWHCLDMNLAPFGHETGVMTTTPTRLTNECGWSMAKLEQVCFVGNGVLMKFRCKSLIILKQIKDAHPRPRGIFSTDSRAVIA